MDRSESVERLRRLIESLVAEAGVELVDLELSGGRLRVFLDKEGGIKLDDCARMNRAIGDLLAARDAASGRYVLEVSSPGLDRPLKTARDFARCVGQKVRVARRREEGAAGGPLVGVIRECIEGAVVLEVDGARVEVALDAVASARLEIEF